MANFKLTISLLIFIFLSGCSGQSLKDYANKTPALDMHAFFSGKIKGWGMFQSRGGEVKRRFVVNIEAQHIGTNTIILNEQFKWDDGSESQRIWRLKKQSQDKWIGTADDVIGEATGEIKGNALHWQYVLALEIDGKTYDVDFDDWMYLIDQSNMLNRSDMNKWGFNLGSVTLNLQKQVEQ